MDVPAIPELSRRLRTLFSEEEAVRLGYVFGSQVDGNAGPLSDLDVAVLVTDGCWSDVTACQARLAHEIRARVAIDDIDLVFLNKAPIELAYHVIADGKRTYETDRATRIDYEAYVLERYGDFLPVLRAQREQILSDSDNDRIQRYRAALGRTERTLAALTAPPGEDEE